MACARCAHGILGVGIALFLIGCSPGQQDPMLTPAEVESQVRASLLVWNTADAERIIETPGPGGNFGGAGFGYRTIAHRAGQSRDEELSIINRVLDSVEYYRVTVDEVNTAVNNDVGLAWGYFTEEFQLRGRSPEVVRVRFTTALARGTRGWSQLLFHRDTQPFDSAGVYIPEATAHPSGRSAETIPEPGGTGAPTSSSDLTVGNPLHGAWLITEMSLTGPTGTSVNENPQPGLYMFTDRHFSIALIPGEERTPFSAERTETERLAAYDNLIVDAGTYELTDSTFTITNIVAKVPNVMPPHSNGNLTFHYYLDGDANSLVLTFRGGWALPDEQITYRLRRLE